MTSFSNPRKSTLLSLVCSIAVTLFLLSSAIVPCNAYAYQLCANADSYSLSSDGLKFARSVNSGQAQIELLIDGESFELLMKTADTGERHLFEGPIYQGTFSDGSNILLAGGGIQSSTGLEMNRLRVDLGGARCDVVITENENVILYEMGLSSFDRDELSAVQLPTIGLEESASLYSLGDVTNGINECWAELSVDLNQGYASTYEGYRDLHSALKSQGSVRLSDYSGRIDTSLFKGNGWKHINGGNSSTPYAFSVYSKSNGPNECLTQYCLMNAVFHDMGLEVGASLAYSGGAIVSYDKATDRLSLKFAELGFTLSKVTLGIHLGAPKAIITGFHSYYLLSGGGLAAALKAVMDPASSLVDFIGQMSFDASVSSSEGRLFDSTFEAQVARYGGKVIKAVGLDSGGKTMGKEGQYMTIQANVKPYESSMGTSPLSKFEYTCQSSI